MSRAVPPPIPPILPLQDLRIPPVPPIIDNAKPPLISQASTPAPLESLIADSPEVHAVEKQRHTVILAGVAVGLWAALVPAVLFFAGLMVTQLAASQIDFQPQIIIRMFALAFVPCAYILVGLRLF